MNRLQNISGRVYIILMFILFTNNLNGQYQLSIKDITVLKEPAEEMMRDYLTNIVDRQFLKRDSLLSTLKSVEDWDLRSQTIRDSMISWTGPFPERTALNVRITGRLDRKDYFIEKIIFESWSNFLLFIV